jgi:hypothetical protein
MIKPPDPQPTAPVIYTVDLGIRITPTASPVSLLSGLSATQRSFIYFPTKDQEIPRLVVPNPATITYKTDGPDPKAMVFNPASPVAQGDLYAAYPGLQKAITSKTAVLSLKAATQKSAVTLPIAATETGWSVTVPAKIEDLPADTYDTVSWVFKDTNGKTEKILISSPITVKKQ